MEIREVEIGVRRVKLLGYYVDETPYRGKSDDEKVVLQFQNIMSIDVSKDELYFTLRAFYSYSEKPEQRLLDFHVQNTFYIKDFANYVVPKGENDNDINLNENAWSIIVGLSLSHTRAFMSNSIYDTVFKHFIIPIVNPLEFTRSILKLKIPDIEKAST